MVVSPSIDVEVPGPLMRALYPELVNVVGRQEAHELVRHYGQRAVVTVPHPLPDGHEVIAVVGQRAASDFADFCMGDSVKMSVLATEVGRAFNATRPRRQRGSKIPIVARTKAELREVRRPKLKERGSKVQRFLSMKRHAPIVTAIGPDTKRLGTAQRERVARECGAPVSLVLEVWAAVMKLRKQEEKATAK